ncbi:unnamed protein product [Urochloa humidicola]
MSTHQVQYMHGGVGSDRRHASSSGLGDLPELGACPGAAPPQPTGDLLACTAHPRFPRRGRADFMLEAKLPENYRYLVEGGSPVET